MGGAVRAARPEQRRAKRRDRSTNPGDDRRREEKRGRNNPTNAELQPWQEMMKDGTTASECEGSGGEGG